MKNEIIPPHRNFNEINPDINLEVIPAQLPIEAVKWPRVAGKPRTAGVSSFGITGTDGHVILQEPLEYTSQRIILKEFERPLHLLTISARTEEGLEALMDRYKAALSDQKGDILPNIAYTANVGRAKFNWRAAVIAKDTSEAISILDSSRVLRGETQNDEGNVCFLFTGQGSQYHGMAKQLYDTSPVFQMCFDHCEEILNKKHKISIAKTFWGEEEANKELVNRTLYSQTGIFVVEYCLMKLWESWGVKPDYVLGHSLGEFCAAVCAGVLTLEEALTLVAERSRLIDGLPGGKMLVIKSDKSSVDNLLKKFIAEKNNQSFWLDYAAINSAEQTVLAGDAENVLEFSAWLKGKNIKSAVLQSTHAFHSRHMDPMLEEYRATAEKIFQNKSNSDQEFPCTYVSGMLGKIVDDSTSPAVNSAEYWVQHTREKVTFLGASKAVYNEGGCRHFLEVGPHPVLTAFIMLNNDGKSMICLPSLRRNETDWKTMLTSVGKLFVNGAVELDWRRFDQFYTREKVGQLLPTYPFQGTKYWPNIINADGVQIHPLLGANIPNPTNSKLFQNNLSLQNVEYLKDHMIGTYVVFPGAGYLETLLMAGHATLDGATLEFRFPRKPIQLENFRIEAPLGLEEGTGCVCQTVVEFCPADGDNLGGLYVRLYHEMKETEENMAKWVPHAQASFSPYNPGSGLNESVDLESKEVYLETIERLKSSGKEETTIKEFYDKVADVGLKFGPTFRTLSKVWRNPEKQQEFLALVKIPKDNGSYLLHPTLIDAMIQVSVFHGEKSKKIEKKLQVPIGCERFIWFRPLTAETKKEVGSNDEDSGDVCYIYSNGNSKAIVLLDKEGNPIAALIKVEAIETNAKSIQALLETQVKLIPDVYKMNWKSTMGPQQHRLDSFIAADVGDVVESEVTDQSDYSEGTLQIKRDEDTLVLFYVTTAFYNLGWEPKIGDKIILDQFLIKLGIKQHHKQLIRLFLNYLEEEGNLIGCDDSECDRIWTIQKIPDPIETMVTTCEEIVQRHIAAQGSPDDFLLLRNVGLKLDKILSGTESALRILFPDDESKPNVAKFYDSIFKRTKHMIYRQWRQTWQNYKTAYEQKNLPVPTIRLLEVGAGTGSVTEATLESLYESGLNYEYHYTDISAAFFPTAEKRFEKYRKSLKFRKLNLEQDPTSQGFPAHYFDFVFGAQVIHATRDIKEAFLNMRLVLKNGGCIVLNEALGGKRMFDCIFGVLEGFWRFTDFELRRHHAMMTYDKWQIAGRKTGFNKIVYAHDFEMSLVVYRATVELDFDEDCKVLNADMRKIQEEARVAWLLFYGEGDEEYVQLLKVRFEKIGRKTLILVKTSQNADKNLLESLPGSPLQSNYEIRASEKQDFEKLFSLILNRPTDQDYKKNFSSIEGILVMWGLCSKVRDQSEVARPFLYLTQSVLRLDKKTLPQVVILTAGQYPLGDILCENPTASTILGMSRCISNEHSELKLRGIDIHPAEIVSSVDEIFMEIFTGFNDEVAHFCAFRNNERFVPRIFPEKVQPKGSNLPLPASTDRFQLIHPKSKSIQDLEFGDLDSFTLKANEIEVKVKCSALNFKDILNILKPIEEFKDSDGVGFDFSGVVTAVGEGVTQRQVGDSVFGINIMGNALPSHIKLPEDAVVPVPESLTYTEAACFPAVFSTAYYCLVNVAKVQKGENLLIHTASGGVGLLTIQLAKYFGLNIICTAGNRRKRAYLKSLGVEHVFHSRNTNYSKEIMEVTNGKGIDIVLNSLTGPGFKEATLGACAKGARFVEMSKLNIWTEEEVAEKRPDLKYTIVDLTKLDEESSRKLLEESRKLVEEGIVKPIPYTRFDAQAIREALTYLQKAQHIGKVVVTMPEPLPGQLDVTQVYTPLFNNRSTYLITGGLGGIGMEVCKYMVNQGAKNVVLVGRKAPTDRATEAINYLKNERGCNAVVFHADVGEWEEIEKMFQDMKDPVYNLPPLRGIMHCAGSIADGLIENQKWEDFSTTFQSKVKGSWNLHELTKDLILEHFVLFSSVTAPFGSPGQSTHVSACTFEDTMAHFRISHGLPAISINWGQFGQIGIAAEADVVSIRPFSPQQGLNALDMIVRQNKNHLMVAAFEKALAGVLKYLPYTKKVVDDQVLKVADSSHNSKKTLQLSSAQFWEDYNECKDEREAKVDVIKNYTKILLRHVLRLDSDEPIDENMDLQDLGVDSLMMLELKNHLQEIMGDRIAITQAAMKDCNTVNLLSDRLVQVIEEEGEFSSIEPPTLDEVREMFLEDSKLPLHIRAQVPGSEKKPSEIKVVLMTGATGVLGSHMLREVLEVCPQLEKIYCLVRTRGGESALERLSTILERKCIMSAVTNFEKVQCISGNFIEERLGLSDPEYFALSNEVDAILHCGAKVSHVEYYRVVPGGRSDARSVNVGGLLKILEFAGLSKTKHVFNASTLLTVHDVDEQDGSLLESWPTDIAPPFNRGYLVSKYICDFLLKAAVDKGIPCKSFKYAELRGSRVTGGSLIETSHYMKSFLFFMKEGVMPESPFPCNFMPIDLASKISLKIMFSDETPNDVYNITHPHHQLAQEYFPKLAEEFGYPVELVPFEEYRKRAVESIEKEDKDKAKISLIAEFQDLYKEEDGFTTVLTCSAKSMTKFVENSERFFSSKKLFKYVPDLYENIESTYEIHKRDLLAGKSEGIFEKIGL